VKLIQCYAVHHIFFSMPKFYAKLLSFVRVINNMKNIKIIRFRANIQRGSLSRLIARRPYLPPFDAVPYLGKWVFHNDNLYFHILNKNCNYSAVDDVYTVEVCKLKASSHRQFSLPRLIKCHHSHSVCNKQPLKIEIYIYCIHTMFYKLHKKQIIPSVSA